MNLQEFADKFGTKDCNRLSCSYTSRSVTPREVKTCVDIERLKQRCNLNERSPEELDPEEFSLEWVYPHGCSARVRCSVLDTSIDSGTLKIKNAWVSVTVNGTVVCTMRSLAPMEVKRGALRQVGWILQPFLRAES